LTYLRGDISFSIVGLYRLIYLGLVAPQFCLSTVVPTHALLRQSKRHILIDFQGFRHSVKTVLNPDCEEPQVADGNNRSGTFLFVDFLDRNGRLLNDKGDMAINNTALTALTLLVAESNPNQKETLIKLIMNMLSLEVLFKKMRCFFFLVNHI
jgi:hypothetical protein